MGTTAERIAFFCARKPWVIIAVASLITVFAAIATARLPIETSRSALFPKGEPNVERLNDFLNTFGSAADLMVVIEGAPREVLEDFAALLASRLNKRPEIRDARERLDTDFVFSHLYLLIPTEALAQIGEAVDRLLSADLPDLSKPVSLDDVLSSLEQWLEEPPSFSQGTLGLSAAVEALNRVDTLLEEWLRFIEAQAAPERIEFGKLAGDPQFASFLEGKGYFATRDGKALIVFVGKKESSSEASVLEPFITAVREEVEALKEEFAASGKVVPTVGLTGLPAVEYEEYEAVQEDIVLVVSSAAVLILALVLFWMRSWKRALIIFLPMVIGSLWNMGLTLFTVGRLTILTAAFTAILFGLGVDYGIFLTSRIIEELPRGQGLISAISRGEAAAVRGILSAATTTVCIFFSLTVVPFQGFRELGIVAGTGVALVVAATLFLGPALFAVLPPQVPRSRQSSQPLPLCISRQVSFAVVFLAIVGACVGLWIGANTPFDYDVLNLLPKGSEAARYQRMLVAESDYQPEVVLVKAKDIAEARSLQARLAELPSVASVYAPVPFFPEDAQARVAIARKVGLLVSKTHVASALVAQEKPILEPKDASRLANLMGKAVTFVEDIQDQAFSAGHEPIVEALERIRTRLKTLASELTENQVSAARTALFFSLLLDAAKKACEVLEGWGEAKELIPGDLPPGLRERFFAQDGSVALYVYPRYSVYSPPMLELLVAQVLSVAPQATGFPVTHSVLSKMAVHSLKYGSLAAFLVALFIIAIGARSVAKFFYGAAPLVIGVGWMLGIMGALEMNFSYANMVGIPMVMALAVDYGVWFAHRFGEKKGLSPWEAASVASNAIVLAAATTLAGLGAIMLGQYQGVSTMGRIVTIGLVCCMVAARLVSPAIADVVTFRRRSSGANTNERG